MRLGILTGGGDCPGLNPLIRGVVKRGMLEFGHEFIGIQNGYQGLVEPDLATPLALIDTKGILAKGGTILGTSNKANPFQYAVKEGGVVVEKDLSARSVAIYRDLKLDGLNPEDMALSSGPEEEISPMAAAMQRARQGHRGSSLIQAAPVKAQKKQRQLNDALERTLQQLQQQKLG